jgi:glutathione S-transferase
MKDGIFIPNLKKKFGFVDKQLQATSYLAGDQFMLPDAYLFVMLLWAQGRNIDLSDCPTLLRYFADLKQRKSIQLSLQEEGL